jgi:hypothetical protein
MNKDLIIKKLSNASDRSGDLLLKMMDRYNTNSLKEVTEEQAVEFYESMKDAINERI